MGFERGFIDFARVEPEHQDVASRICHFDEFIKTYDDKTAINQAGRCMDCGIPFCTRVCPLHNVMPEINQAVCEGNFEKAYKLVSMSNNFPEITGRICPALCEDGCTLSLTDKSVSIKAIERKISEYAFSHGLVGIFKPQKDTKKQVAVVGSGPAALACAQELTRLGNHVTIYEKNSKVGGLLRFGIPDFKFSKSLIDRRLSQMEQEGVKFIVNTMVGKKEDLGEGVHCEAINFISGQSLTKQYDAVVLCPGSEQPRDLQIPGRELKGIYFALDFLIAQNKENDGEGTNPIDVKGKKVVVIGGGETASDCIGTAIRKGASSVTQLDYHDELPEHVDPHCGFPYYKKIKRTSTSQQEGCTRIFSTNTTSFEGEGKVSSIRTVKVKWGPNRKITPIEGTQGQMDADIVLIAMGYAHPSVSLVNEFKLKTDSRGNIAAPTDGENAYKTSCDKVFAAGDGRKGQSLVVYAIAEGRQCAYAVNRYLNH